MLFFFFKQKTAYEMRISDWSSDVCSSDLGLLRFQESITPSTWTFIALIILSGLAILVTMTRAGIDLLWTPVDRPQSHLRIIEAVPIGLLLAVCLALMIQAGPIMTHQDRKTVAVGMRVPVRVEHGGCRIIK